MAEDDVRVHRTSDEGAVEALVPEHPHLTRPLADRADKQFLLASVDAEAVGTAWVRPLAAATGAFGGLWVEPEHRGKGLGGRLMDAGLAELALGGARVGMLGVHLDNEEGLALARTRGFRTVSFVPGRSTGAGALVAGFVEKVSPLPFPDRSTRLMAVWLDEDRLEHRPEPAPADPSLEADEPGTGAAGTNGAKQVSASTASEG